MFLIMPVYATVFDEQLWASEQGWPLPPKKHVGNDPAPMSAMKMNLPLSNTHALAMVRAMQRQKQHVHSTGGVMTRTIQARNICFAHDLSVQQVCILNHLLSNTSVL